jgi:serine/threonine protein kinase
MTAPAAAPPSAAAPAAPGDIPDPTNGTAVGTSPTNVPLVGEDAGAEDTGGGEPTDEPPPLPPGAEVAPGYTVLAHLRRGEDFDAYEAWSAARYSRCFVKTPRPDRTDHASVRRSLVREGRLLLRTCHPHLVRAYDLHAPRSGPPVLVLETLPGPSLKIVLEEHGRLPTSILAILAAHLCSAARYLHDRGHLHLDIKPSNVVLSGGVARLVDLGLSGPPGPCRAGVGTARSMAPEQARGDHVSAATDVWGIGLVLYEAATGHRPFGDGDDDRTCSCGDAGCEWREPRYLQLERRAPRVRARRRLPVGAAAAIDACLTPDPADRPSLAALDAALSEMLGAQ